MLQIISSEDRSISRPLDQFDRRILDLLQRDATVSLAEISARVGLSQTPCWRRIQRLEQAGIIRKRIAVLDAERVGLAVTAYVFLKVSSHERQSISRFTEAVQERPEVVSASRVTGDYHFVLKVVVADLAAYDRFYRDFISTFAFEMVSAQFVMDAFKQHGPIDLNGEEVEYTVENRKIDRIT